MFDLTWIEIIYWASTIIGGTLFILRAAMMLIGGFGDGGMDADLSGDVSGDFHTDVTGDHAEADVSFKLISIQGLTSFFMMFGLVGLALLKANVPVFLTVVGGIVAGLITVAITGLVFTQMKRLQTEGNIDIQKTIGTEGSVYLTIPKNGTGQVQLIAQGSLKIFDAVSNSKSTIATGEKVRVMGVASGTTLIVEKAN
jgi:membrane protein implicated in regulation of membrane protease activity